jgi:hypothetical protein
MLLGGTRLLGADVFFMMVPRGPRLSHESRQDDVTPLRPDPSTSPCHSYFRRGLGSTFPGPRNAKGFLDRNGVRLIGPGPGLSIPASSRIPPLSVGCSRLVELGFASPVTIERRLFWAAVFVRAGHVNGMRHQCHFRPNPPASESMHFSCLRCRHLVEIRCGQHASEQAVGNHREVLLLLVSACCCDGKCSCGGTEGFPGRPISRPQSYPILGRRAWHSPAPCSDPPRGSSVVSLLPEIRGLVAQYMSRALLMTC